MGTWTDQGFVANQLSYYESAIQQVFLDAFGSDFDLNPNLPQNILIHRLAELFYAIDMDGVEAFARLNLNTMGGLFLDVIGNWRGVSRILGTPQTGVAKITCKADNFVPFTLPEGTVLTSETGEQFVTTVIKTLDSNTANVSIAYSENGNSGTIVGNTMTIDGYPQILNIEVISLFDGTENESDISYRSRLQKEYPAAVGTIEYVNNKLRALPSVESVGCVYNDSDTEQDSIPPYCTEWIVVPDGEVAAEAIGVFKEGVAKVIVDNKVPGSPTSGNTSVITQDIFGSNKIINFTIAEAIPIEVSVVVSTPEATGIFDLSSINEIKQAAADYINSLGVGIDVSYSRCVAPFAADKGFDVISFKMKTSDKLIGVDTKTYTRNPIYDTANTLAWRIGDNLTPAYYTQDKVFPEVGDTIFSDAECTVTETTVDSIDTSPWVENSNYLISARQYAVTTTEDISVGV